MIFMETITFLKKLHYCKFLSNGTEKILSEFVINMTIVIGRMDIKTKKMHYLIQFENQSL